MTNREQIIEIMAQVASERLAPVEWELLTQDDRDKYLRAMSDSYDVIRDAGLVVVPEEPIEAMLKAPRHSAVPSELRNLRQDYKAMIAAYTDTVPDREEE